MGISLNHVLQLGVALRSCSWEWPSAPLGTKMDRVGSNEVGSAGWGFRKQAGMQGITVYRAMEVSVWGSV